MEKFTLKMTDQVQTTLSQIEQNESDVLLKARRCIELLEENFDILKEFIISYEFNGPDEEIRFFKEIKPGLFSYLIFYQKVYNIEMNRPKGDLDEQKAYLKRKLCRLSDYFDDNRDFYKYYRSGETHLDSLYYLRHKPDVYLAMESFYFERNAQFSTAADFKMAKVIANDQLEQYLNEQLWQLEYETAVHMVTAKENWVWMFSKTDMAEVILPLYLLEAFNGGKLIKSEYIRRIENTFGIDMSNFSRIVWDLKRRKNPTQFLDEMKEALTDYLKKDFTKNEQMKRCIK